MKTIIHIIKNKLKEIKGFLIFFGLAFIIFLSVIRFFPKGGLNLLVSFSIALFVFWKAISFFAGSLKPDFRAGIIIMVFTAWVGGPLIHFNYPPPSKTLSRFLIPQLNYCLFGYVKRLGFLLDYRFDNTGFKGMSPIDLSTYNIFLNKNLPGLRQHLEKRDNTNYTREQVQEMNSMFGDCSNAVDKFISRYENSLDDGLLDLLYRIRYICEYSEIYTSSSSSSLEFLSPNEKVVMGKEISNEPMKTILILIEEIVKKINEGRVLKTGQVAIY